MFKSISSSKSIQWNNCWLMPYSSRLLLINICLNRAETIIIITFYQHFIVELGLLLFCHIFFIYVIFRILLLRFRLKLIITQILTITKNILLFVNLISYFISLRIKFTLKWFTMTWSSLQKIMLLFHFFMLTLILFINKILIINQSFFFPLPIIR